MITAQAVSFDVKIDLLALVIGMNIVLTFLHWALFRLREKHAWRWSQTAINIVDFLLSMVGWFAAMRMPARSTFLESQKEFDAKEQAKK